MAENSVHHILRHGLYCADSLSFYEFHMGQVECEVCVLGQHPGSDEEGLQLVELVHERVHGLEEGVQV